MQGEGGGAENNDKTLLLWFPLRIKQDSGRGVRTRAGGGGGGDKDEEEEGTRMAERNVEKPCKSVYG